MGSCWSGRPPFATAGYKLVSQTLSGPKKRVLVIATGTCHKKASVDRDLCHTGLGAFRNIALREDDILRLLTAF